MEPCESVLAEDEVDGAYDERVSVELSARLGVKCVLVAVETTAVVALVCDAGADGEILAVFVDVAEGVEDIEIVLEM